MSLTTPFTPTSPDTPANHPGTPMRISSFSGVWHQGCGGGGGVSFEMSYSDPAKRTGTEKMIVATTAVATRCNFVFTSEFLSCRTPKSEKNKLSRVGYVIGFNVLTPVRCQDARNGAMA